MNNKLYKLMNWAAIEEIIYSESDHPQELLGPHVKGSNTLLQCFFPGACGVGVTWSDETQKDVQLKMELADEDGYFAALIPSKKVIEYSYQVSYEQQKEDGKTFSKETVNCKDPYAYKLSLTEKQVNALLAGEKSGVSSVFGAHVTTVDGVIGTRFTVLAPNAIRVSVVGEFNKYDGRMHQMMRVGDSGVFELFIPGATGGMHYQYELKLKGDQIKLKNDPFGSLVINDRGRVSVIPTPDNYSFSDTAFRKAHNKKETQKPVIIYHLSITELLDRLDMVGDFEKWCNSFAAQRKEEGFTYVQLPLLMAGNLESGYPLNFYSIDENILTKQQLQIFSNTLHICGIGLILTWNGAGFSMAEDGMGGFDGTALFEHMDPRQGIGPEGSCYLLQYGNLLVRNMLLESLKYYVETFHLDGVSISSVAQMLYLDYGKQEGQWIPNMYGGNENLEAIQLLKDAITMLGKEYPWLLVIAEDNSCHPLITESLDKDGFGFDYKWNMSYVEDMKSYLSMDPLYRGGQHQRLTNELVYAYVEKFLLPITEDSFGGNVESSFSGNDAQKEATLRCLLGYSLVHPGCLLLGASVVSRNQKLVCQLNQYLGSLPALSEKMDTTEGFEWLSHMNADGCYVSFVRKTLDPEEMLVIVVNFAGSAQSITTGVPYEGKYKEILNTDASVYGGEGTTNVQTRKAIDVQADGRAQSITVKMAPLSISVLQFLAYTEVELAKVIEERIRRNTPIKKSKK